MLYRLLTFDQNTELGGDLHISASISGEQCLFAFTHYRHGDLCTD